MYKEKNMQGKRMIAAAKSQIANERTLEMEKIIKSSPTPKIALRTWADFKIRKNQLPKDLPGSFLIPRVLQQALDTSTQRVHISEEEAICEGGPDGTELLPALRT